mgnify:CR=1 FL=1
MSNQTTIIMNPVTGKVAFEIVDVKENRIYITRSYASQKPLEHRCEALGLRLHLYGHEARKGDAHPYIVVSRDGVGVSESNWREMLVQE